VRDLIKHAKGGRDRLMLQVAYFGGLRVGELVSLTWSQVIRRDSGEAQLSVVGKGDKDGQNTDPCRNRRAIAGQPGERTGVGVGIRVCAPIWSAAVRTRVNYIVTDVAERAGVNPAASVHWPRHAHASHAIDNGAPITLVSATLGHADLKTTSVYAHARPGESSGRYLKTK
jgi:integrase/recombinase XerD